MDRPILLPWWRRKQSIQLAAALAVLLLVVVFAIAFLGTAERTVRIPASNVTIATVTEGPFHDFVPLRATVVSLNTVYLDALEGGRVERVLAEAGDLVQQGQSLVELSNTELELNVLDREGRLIESITQLQSYETQLEQNRIGNQKALAQIEYDIVRLERSLRRHRRLAPSGMEAAEILEAAEDELEHMQKLRPMQAESNQKQEELRVRQTPQIRSQLDKLYTDLQITHAKLDNLNVRAPVTGRLTSMDLKVGENRNRGERFAEITPETGNKLAAAVEEFYLGKVRVGQIADVQAADRTWQLKVTRVYPQVKEGTFTVDLAWEGAGPEGLLPGQSLQGKLALGADRKAVILPAGAFLERSGGDWVFVVDRDGDSAERRRIKTGRRNVEQVEVLGNLKVGERVIVSDYGGLDGVERIDLEP